MDDDEVDLLLPIDVHIRLKQIADDMGLPLQSLVELAATLQIADRQSDPAHSAKRYVM